MQRCCCVSFRHRGGEYSNTTMGREPFRGCGQRARVLLRPALEGTAAGARYDLGRDYPRRASAVSCVLAGRIERWTFERLRPCVGVAVPPGKGDGLRRSRFDSVGDPRKTTKRSSIWSKPRHWRLDGGGNESNK